MNQGISGLEGFTGEAGGLLFLGFCGWLIRFCQIVYEQIDRKLIDKMIKGCLAQVFFRFGHKGIFITASTRSLSY